jgi:anaerobic ribonucleoside-triphosphate reductase activating protein
LLGLIDILVDGRYEEELADITLAFRGSKNQRVLNLPATLTTGEPVLYLE